MSQAALVNLLERASGPDAFLAVREWLQRHPATYAMLVEQAQISPPWGEISPGSFERHSLTTDRTIGAVEPREGWWDAEVMGQDLPECFASPREAMAAIDGVLGRELGWTLIEPVVTP